MRSMINAWRRGVSAGWDTTEMWVHRSNSRMTWSNGRSLAITALTTSSGVIPGTRRSAAQPTLCCEESFDPTASFTAFDRNALLTMIGLPPSSSLTCSKKIARRTRFVLSVSLGSLDSSLCSVVVSSSSEKWALSSVVMSVLSCGASCPWLVSLKMIQSKTTGLALKHHLKYPIHGQLAHA